MILSSFLLGSSVHSNQESSSGMPTIRLHIVERDLIVGSLVLDAMRQLNLLASSSSSSSSNHQTSLVSLEEQNIAKQLARCLTMEQGGGVSVLNRLRTSCTSTSSSSQDDSTQSTTINNEASALSVQSSKVPYPPDVIYLDPMFPPRKKKSSAVKKDMAMLHSLLGTANGADDESTRITSNSNALNEEANGEEEVDDAGQAVTTRAKEEQALLHAAYDSAVCRVVVKRPIGAPPLGLSNKHDDKHNDDDVVANNSKKNDDADIINNDVDTVPKPSYEIRGSVNRFDVYMIS